MELAGSPLGYEKITGLSVAKGLTVPPNASRALVQGETQDVRFRDDGTDPDATTGVTLKADGSMNLEGDYVLKKIKFIEVTPSATLHVLYYS